MQRVYNNILVVLITFVGTQCVHVATMFTKCYMLQYYT